ncbi:MAG: DEAD/DEAH box helicase [Rickettsiales bacterium]|jgi:superfamily II DNA/RNA helicase|nr:DEAD/DEAH box helicase [Rickettsiales bacterium]
MNDFLSLGLPQPLLDALKRINFNTPTPIQAQAIPPALEGKDILGSAQTGTGKTGAFGIPLVAKLLASPRGSALVMTPTRELAMQVIEMIDQLTAGPYNTIKSVLLIGGESMPKQIQQLRARPRLIVGTPGRINDHLERGSLMLHDANFLVLDETDRMLDMGFETQIERVVKFLPPQRQTLLFSATLPDNIVKLSSKYLNNPVRVSVGSTTSPIAKIKQEVIHTREDAKYSVLQEQLAVRTGSIIVFVKTKWGAEKMATRLRKEKHTVEAIHGDLRQNRREKVIDGFRDYKYRILVATDIAARGLDIPHIEHVINYDLPQAPEDYIHRIGRTGRAGAEGSALNLITPADDIKWRAIQRLMNPNEKHPPRGPQGNHGGQSQQHRGANHRPSNGSSKNRRRRPFRGGQRSARPPQQSAA